MKPVVALVGFFAVSATKTLAQVPAAAPAISVIRTGNGCDITLPPSEARAVVDRMYLVIDGKSEGLVAWYNPDALHPTKSIHYLASTSSDMDSQVKDILKAQGLPTKPDVTTYHIAAGIGFPVSGGGYFPAVATLSKTLHFAHASGQSVNVLVFADNKFYYNLGDKIPVFDEVVLDSNTTLEEALGPNNNIDSGKFVTLPPGQMHRITIQVQFVPKTKETGAASMGAGEKKGQG